MRLVPQKLVLRKLGSWCYGIERRVYARWGVAGRDQTMEAATLGEVSASHAEVMEVCRAGFVYRRCGLLQSKMAFHGSASLCRAVPLRLLSRVALSWNHRNAGAELLCFQSCELNKTLSASRCCYCNREQIKRVVLEKFYANKLSQ